MKSIIIAYPIKETALKIKEVLTDNGLYVSHICATGASVLSIAADLRGGIVVCASMLRDSSAGALADFLPAGFDIVALSKNGRESYAGNYISLPLPLDKDEFVKTVLVLATSESSFTNREKDDSEYISNAKAILMSANDMSEMQAHKYLQKMSMEQSKKMVDVAKEIIKQLNS